MDENCTVGRIWRRPEPSSGSRMRDPRFGISPGIMARAGQETVPVIASPVQLEIRTETPPRAPSSAFCPIF